jgi:hypothetical protein
MAHAVEIAGIEQRDPGIERCMDGRDAFLPIGRAIHARHAHAAEAERGYGGSVCSKLALLHLMFSLMGTGRPVTWEQVWDLALRSIIRH